jgi:prepilin-type processing-associated H-X9-DG protein
VRSTKWNEGANGAWGMTLIEVLVIVAIVGILILLLLPPPGHSREKYRRAICLSNLRQVGQAISLYAADYSGRCPVDETNATLLGCMRLLSNKLVSAEVLYCPSDSWGRPTRTNDFSKLTTNNVSYSYVPNLIWNSGGPRKILALDWIKSTTSGSAWDIHSNHKDTGGNVLFTDGQVEWHTTLPTALIDRNGKEIVLSP